MRRVVQQQPEPETLDDDHNAPPRHDVHVVVDLDDQRFDHEFDRARIQPSAPLINQLADGIRIKSTSVLLAQLELDLQAALARHRHYLGRRQTRVGEAFSALDSRHSKVRAQVHVWD